MKTVGKGTFNGWTTCPLITAPKLKANQSLGHCRAWDITIQVKTMSAEGLLQWLLLRHSEVLLYLPKLTHGMSRMFL